MVSTFEIRRKAFHIVTGILLMFLFYMDWLSSKILFIILVIGIILSYLSRTYEIPIISWFLLKFERPEHLASFPGKGALFFVLGFFLCTILFQKDVTLAAICVLTIGDALSHIIGANFGIIKHPFSDTKFIEGHIAGALISSFLAAYFVPFWISLCSALVGMFMEGVDLVIHSDSVDDNLIIPLTTGAVMTLLLWI